MACSENAEKHWRVHFAWSKLELQEPERLFLTDYFSFILSIFWYFFFWSNPFSGIRLTTNLIFGEIDDSIVRGVAVESFNQRHSLDWLPFVGLGQRETVRSLLARGCDRVAAAVTETQAPLLCPVPPLGDTTRASSGIHMN